MSNILITGLGLISAIGDSVAQNRQSLINGRSGIGKARYFRSRYAETMPFAEVKTSTEQLQQLLAAPRQYPQVTRTDLIALKAMGEAIADAQLSPEVLHNSSTAFISASTVGGMCLTDEMYRDANTTAATSDSPYLSAYSNSASTLFLQSYFNIGGIVNTFNTACSSSANAIMYGARLLKNGLAKKAIVGGTDSLAKFTVNGFNSLMILSAEACRPFDNARKGLNLGEAGGFIILERAEDVPPDKKVYAEIKGFGNSNDAFHPSSTSENADGPYLCMKTAIEVAGLEASDIDFINAHGTATENNDATESVAMLRLFETVPAFASTKSYTGHTLGAAGAAEAIFSILSLYHQEVYPSLNFETPIENTGLVPVPEYQPKQLRHVMSNSFGFGGNCTSLIFSVHN
ncbi:3-oxoacyl-ACP synthase [Niabella ginsenosidivorans]|uniref:3-oxoacyl-ACP synthase n=1 Tax=Niabella ginsenosidivorans TaxID=1176587 RepID=A0A1A9IA20_9BACT|nr:beta-ketoacyl-[acyl-carrier-protein] synthase family protein [Niabella ginsenosidivorans]ANH83521.1 3-oxoacyl-ACP synthase [Niabella ginsenosidivorans]